MAPRDSNGLHAKLSIEADDSWSNYVSSVEEAEDGTTTMIGASAVGRRLRHHKHHHHDEEETNDHQSSAAEKKKGGGAPKLEEQRWIRAELLMREKIAEERAEKDSALRAKTKRQNRKNHEAILSGTGPGIKVDTVHGMMIDAGSTGSRLHIYEFEPRVLRSDGDGHDIEEAVSGMKLSFPGTESRWTERLRPGLGTFASLPDEELLPAVKEYLSPLIDFAKEVLRSKEGEFSSYPIYLKGTAGLRILSPHDRTRVMSAVRRLLADDDYCPFSFENERARVISGEEEAIYGWTSVNFLMGTLLENSRGVGTVVDPRLTYGALDLGGASTQISFYEPDGDIMSDLFKLQIGMGKHWNVYAHSYLRYGMNEAKERMMAGLVWGKTAKERLEEGVRNPCLPGGSERMFSSELRFDADGVETFAAVASAPADDDGAGTNAGAGTYSALLVNRDSAGSWEECSTHVRSLLRKDANGWCDYSHGGDCSFNGVYQPHLPLLQSDRFGEFLGFSNFHHVWKFLRLEPRSSLGELLEATRRVCSMGWEELLEYNKDEGDGGSGSTGVDDAVVVDYCFHSAYVFHLLHDGYGFPLDYHITATNVVKGQKVGWALGAMLYEINTLPWKYVDETKSTKGGEGVGLLPGVVPSGESSSWAGGSSLSAGCVLLFVVLGMTGLLFRLFRVRHRRRREEYEPLKECEVEIVEDDDSPSKAA